MENEMTMKDSCGTVDRFSWSRVWGVGLCWWPVLKWEFWIFLAYSVCSAVIAGLVDRYAPVPLAVNLTNLSGVMLSCGASVFAVKKCREWDLTAPALNSEKRTMMLIWTLVVLPLITWWTATLIYYGITGFGIKGMTVAKLEYLEYNVEISDTFVWLANLFGVVNTYAAAMVCLYLAVIPRKRSVLKSAVFGFLTVSIPGFLMGLISGLYAAKQGFDAGFAGAAGGPDVEQIVAGTVDMMMIMMPVFMGIQAVVFIVALTMLIRNFSKRQG